MGIRVEEIPLDYDKLEARMNEFESEIIELEQEMRGQQMCAESPLWENESTSTTASDGSEAWKLPFLAVGRVKDAAVLASYDTKPGGEMDDFKIQFVMRRAQGLTGGQYCSLPCNC